MTCSSSATWRYSAPHQTLCLVKPHTGEALPHKEGKLARPWRAIGAQCGHERGAAQTTTMASPPGPPQPSAGAADARYDLRMTPYHWRARSGHLAPELTRMPSNEWPAAARRWRRCADTSRASLPEPAFPTPITNGTSFLAAGAGRRPPGRPPRARAATARAPAAERRPLAATAARGSSTSCTPRAAQVRHA